MRCFLVGAVCVRDFVRFVSRRNSHCPKTSLTSEMLTRKLRRDVNWAQAGVGRRLVVPVDLIAN